MRLLESSVKVVDTKVQPADAIIVLSGGTYFGAPEFGSPTVNEASLLRLRYAAILHRETGKPILVTGGKPLGNSISEAQLMKAVMEQELKVPVRWTEDASNNTLEQARYSYRLLHEFGIKHIYLVTNAWHMPRAAMAFRSAGFEVVPAPTAFTARHKTNFMDFLPTGTFGNSQIFIHEIIGTLWYWLRT